MFSLTASRGTECSNNTKDVLQCQVLVRVKFTPKNHNRNYT